MASSSPVPARGRRLQSAAVKSGSNAPALTLPVEPPPIHLERTPFVQWMESLSGEGGLSLLISVVLHLLLLGALAIPVINSMQREREITSLVQNPSGTSFAAVGEPGGMEMALHSIDPPAASDPMKSLLNDAPDRIGPMLLPNVNPSDLPSLAADAKSSGKGKGKGMGMGMGIGNGIGGGNGTGLDGVRIAEPMNAIRAGNFSVWCWPIVGKDQQGEIHGEPGSSPAVFQHYHIVIRLKVPEGRKTVNLSDFSGQVVGSDSYFQKIPQDAWFYNTKGDLVRARTGRAIPVIEGTAELLIRVPGAGIAATRDTITVSSRLTDEEQKIELVFQDRRVQ